MLCPEGSSLQNGIVLKNDEKISIKSNHIPVEGTSTTELRSYKHLKTWKKSITNFFRNQLGSTKSNDGDRPSGSKDDFENKDVAPGQKWQSLGKVFRRQSFAEHWPKSPFHGVSSLQGKRHAVRKVISSYFGKSLKTDTNSDKS